MEIVLVAVISIALGLVVGWLWAGGKSRKTNAEFTEKINELVLKNQSLSMSLDNERRNIQTERKRLEERLESERRQAMALRAEDERRWKEIVDSLQVKLQKASAEHIAAGQEALKKANILQMDEILQPLREKFAEFKRSVDETRTQSKVDNAKIQESFINTMKLFQQEQQHVVNALREQTQKIGDDAANLTKALKGESKVQGDWGEMILESVLEHSGLRKNEEFFVQDVSRDSNGRILRPDVVVRFPEGKSLVIDSKVSLTAYSKAVDSENEIEQQQWLREHAMSVRRHIDELARKDYDKVVKEAIGLVLMFIPNESSYIAAIRQQPDLLNYAYEKRIILISPGNLLMSLKLAYNSWQNDRQNKNIDKIVKNASDLYDKVAGFSETFEEMESQLTKLSKTFGEAKNRLYTGQGNVMRRIENLKELGITPKKRIKGLDALD